MLPGEIIINNGRKFQSNVRQEIFRGSPYRGTNLGGGTYAQKKIFFNFFFKTSPNEVCLMCVLLFLLNDKKCWKKLFFKKCHLGSCHLFGFLTPQNLNICYHLCAMTPKHTRQTKILFSKFAQGCQGGILKNQGGPSFSLHKQIKNIQKGSSFPSNYLLSYVHM